MRAPTGGAGRPALLLLLLAALAGAALAGSAAAAVSVEAAPSTFTGASYLATANVTSSGTIVLYEWDFDGDGVRDANATGDPQASHVFTVASAGYRVQVTVTFERNGTLETEAGSLQVAVADGTPSVAVDLPDRIVAGVELTFTARASDPDPSPGGEPFSYAWTLDGAPVGGAADHVAIVAPSTGPHEVAVVATDAEGLTRRAVVTPDFGAPGIFEGKGGAINLGLLAAAAALALGLPLAALQRRERRAASLNEETRVARASEEAAPPKRHEREPGKVPLAASSEGAGSAPRISLGGKPSSLIKTRECPVCHNAVDADDDFCPFCAGNERAAAFEERLEKEPFDMLDLSEVRALVAHARRERHLGRHDIDRELMAKAQAAADGLSSDAFEAQEWLPRAERAVERAKAGGGGEQADRAEAYLKLAQSLARARQFGKAARHARRTVEIAEASPEESAGAPARDDSEGKVRDELARLRQEVGGTKVELDQQALELLKAAEAFEAAAEWAQALEVIGALREKLARAREADAEAPSAGGGDPPRGPAA